jgi:iron complex outermembrane receptor protein
MQTKRISLFKQPWIILIALILPLQVFAQAGSRTITGIVLDENNEPMVGVTVIVPGTTTGTATDINGGFSLVMAATATELEFSYIGYESMIVPITGNRVEVQMTPDINVMDELVVIGYGTRKRGDLTGAISSVSEKDFNQGMISSPEQLVNGKIAGMQIVNSGGSPSAGSTIRVRGGASLNASNDPLIVLDGVPMEIGGSVSGSGNFLSLLNPNDIESMTVLKDASSTAIYGSRASNGVIIIETKKGGDEKLRVSLQTTNSLQSPTKNAEMLSREEFVDVINSQGTAAQKALLGTANTHWNDQVFRTGFGTDNNLSVSGRMGLFPFRASTGVFYQEGVLKRDDMSRFTGNINLTPSLLDNHLRLNISGKGAWTNTNWGDTGAIRGASVYNPTWAPYDEDSPFGGYTEVADPNGNRVTGAQPNPLGRVLQRKDNGKAVRVIGNIDADYQLHGLPELRFHLTGGYDYSKGRGTVYEPAEAYNNYNISGYDYSYGPQNNYNRLFTIYANYNKALDAINSSLDFTAGYDYQFWKRTAGSFEQLNTLGEVQSTSAASDQRHALLSYYGRLNYGLADRYMLTATIRRDGSSRFAESTRWGTFPSVAFAWRVNNEPWFESAGQSMSDLKLRMSYGVTGQQDGIPNYGYIPVYTISQPGADYMFGGQPISTYRPEGYNPDLKWETTGAWNFGVDFGFLNNRVSGSIDYYDRKTKDLLATVPIPAGVNFNKTMLTNVGNMESNGLEFALNATLIQTNTMSWTVSANATYQNNQITNLTLVEGAESPNTLVGPTVGVGGQQIQVFTEGYAPYSFYVHKQVYDEESGRPIEGLYADLDGNGVINSNDLYHYRSIFPDWIAGISTMLQWRKFSLSTSLRASIGNYVYNNVAMDTGAFGTVSYNAYELNNLHSSYLETGFVSRQQLSDHYVENASFLKMDNLRAGYDFGPVSDHVSLHLSAMVQNVFTITKYRGVDPEISSGVDSSLYPRPRIFSITVGLEF